MQETIDQIARNSHISESVHVPLVSDDCGVVSGLGYERAPVI